ncbi:PhoPQ-activated pathogenicity-related protein [Heterostelium album PN500]|uniref:PhoPQ-activated pathogenicity-related protein n=1 Tax=Heterostelium pallidum (strain ATCC 26659 / Pp 5 / PN500) TaxID=670386 RepID=D3BSH8_HETP5|nr:PhoPQ-activated pathogenicity-related protein [Heterostelium album PN500]EFA75636.1 PhoPQ-activated pathogenicity-related protein [Heterostelium album PN500]|eukprot:XP_020427770.1 PhoPQ-activated pathogenicity-related protein [Heterostelium album PN500]
MKYTLLFLSTLVLLGSIQYIQSTPLDDYVNAPDASYKWTLNNTIHATTYTAFILELTSQTWMTTAESDWPVWKHWLSICVPNEYSSSTAFMYVDGGHNTNWQTPNSVDSTIEIACLASKGITVGLTQIPNQPIMFFNDGVGRSEDALIAYTWRHFLNNTEDPVWLARLPMTKAVVKAMDAVQEFGKTIPYDVQNFVVAGASKRGWTTWTTAAVDSRVVVAVPIVMPILDMVPNMGHQWQAYGNWSFAMQDYLDQGIMAYLNTPEMEQLAAIVDPYSYIDRLTMPKYVVCSTGDEFFLPDSPSFFFSQLLGEKHLRLVPNAEHSLIGHQLDIIMGIVTMSRLYIQNQTRPEFDYNIAFNSNGTATITLTVQPGTKTPYKVKSWEAITESAERRDFRLITCMDPTKCIQPILWKPETLTGVNGVYTATMGAPTVGWRGFFLEAEYVYENPFEAEYTMKYTSEVAIVPNTLPFPPCGNNCQVRYKNSKIDMSGADAQPHIGVLPKPGTDVVLLNDQLAIIKDCNYRLVNSITGAESIQKEKDSINVNEPVKGYDHLLRKISRLQYYISIESEDLINSIERLESLEIHGHIKHRRKERRLKKRTESLAALSAAAAHCKDAPSTQQHDVAATSRTTTTTQHEHQHESAHGLKVSNEPKTHHHLEPEDLDATVQDSSESSDSSSDSSESDEEIKFGPRKLRKFRKLLLGKIECLINYLDKMSKELSEMKDRAFERKKIMPHIPWDLSLKDSFDLQSPEVRRMINSPPPPAPQATTTTTTTTTTTNNNNNSLVNNNPAVLHSHNGAPCTNAAHLHIPHTHVKAISPLTESINNTRMLSPITPSIDLRASHERCCSPAFNERFKNLNIQSPQEIFQVDNIQYADEDDFDNQTYTKSPSTPVQQLNQYRQRKKEDKQHS